MIHIHICICVCIYTYIYIYIHTHTHSHTVYKWLSLSHIISWSQTCLSNFLFCKSAWISNFKHNISKTEILTFPSTSASFSLPHLRQWQFYLLVSQVTNVAVILSPVSSTPTVYLECEPCSPPPLVPSWSDLLSYISCLNLFSPSFLESFLHPLHISFQYINLSDRSCLFFRLKLFSNFLYHSE